MNKSNYALITAYEKGKQYKIKKAWDISIKVSIDNKSQETALNFLQLEIFYKKFLETEQIPYDKSLIDFSEKYDEILLESVDTKIALDEWMSKIKKT